MNPRVLIISHGHPDFTLGGGEIAAHAQWKEFRRRHIDAMFLARIGQSPRHAGASFSNRSADGLEVLFSAPPVDHFRHSQPQRRVVYEEFRALLERFRPTVVHFHHYVHLGLEMIREARKFMPQGVIAVTLHEYLGICHAQGQMLKINGLLCAKAAPLDCSQCFPDITPQDFFLRELFIKSFFTLVDHFICPSKFLRDRYVEWGLPAEKMQVLENGQPGASRTGAASGSGTGVKTPPIEIPGGVPVGVAPPAGDALRRKFVILGQLSRLKGTLVALEAARLLPRRLRRKIIIEIHGAIQFDVNEFKANFARALAGLEDTVRHCGPYRPEDVGGIVQRAGWVIVPSIWWENSPLVIQESFAAGRPVICSNIGGMAEKVTPGVSGLHFRVGSASDLAECIESAATEPGLWETLCAGCPSRRASKTRSIASSPCTVTAAFARPPRSLARWCRSMPPAEAAAGALRGDEHASFYRGLKVMVTGGLGFIGSNLARRLVELGAHVRVVDAMIANYGGNLANVSDIEKQLEICIVNLTDAAAMNRLVADRDIIFNLAGQVSHLDSMIDPVTDLDANARGQILLLEACRKHAPQARIAFASTRQIYGRPVYWPVDEKHPLHPVDVNGIHKMAAEAYHTLYHEVYGLWTTSLRLTNTYGPRMRVKDARQTFLGIWLRRVIENGEIEVWGGRQQRDLTYVEDVVDAFLRAMASPQCRGQTYNLGGCPPVSLSDLARSLVSVAGTGTVVYREFPEDLKRIDIGDYFADDRRFREATGWAPTLILEEGLGRSVAYYRQRLGEYV